MKPEDALRLAATSVDADVDVDRARRIIHAFIENLAACPACGGSEKLVTAREVRYDPPPEVDQQSSLIPVGQLIDCPCCGPGGIDLTSVVWQCQHGKAQGVCAGLRSADPSDNSHAACGWHALVAVNLFDEPTDDSNSLG